jgi:hypothetical protein
MSTPASPSSSPSKGGSKGGEDELWEEAFAKMDEQEPLFQNLPETEEDARKVFEKFDDKSSHAGPILLVKGVPPGAFGDWLRRSELGLHKAERLTNGTVCDDILVGGAALTFNAQTFLDECEYDDPEEQM